MSTTTVTTYTRPAWLRVSSVPSPAAAHAVASVLSAKHHHAHHTLSHQPIESSAGPPPPAPARGPRLVSRQTAWAAGLFAAGAAAAPAACRSLHRGPLISLVAYAYIFVTCWKSMQAVSTMTRYMPVGASVAQFEFHFLVPCLVLSMNVVYWLAWTLTLAGELSLAGSLAARWPAFRNHPRTTIFAAWAVLTATAVWRTTKTRRSTRRLLKHKANPIPALAAASVGVFVLTVDSAASTGFQHPCALLTHAVSSNIMVSQVLAGASFAAIAWVRAQTTDSPRWRPATIAAIARATAVVAAAYTAAVCAVSVLISPPGTGVSESSPFMVSLANAILACCTSIRGPSHLVLIASLLYAASRNIHHGSHCLTALSKAGHLPRLTSRTAVATTASVGLVGMFPKAGVSSAVFTVVARLTFLCGVFLWIFIMASYIHFSQVFSAKGLRKELAAIPKRFPSQLAALNCMTVVGAVQVLVLCGPGAWSLEWLSRRAWMSALWALPLTITGVKVHWNDALFVRKDDPNTFTAQRPLALIRAG